MTLKPKEEQYQKPQITKSHYSITGKKIKNGLHNPEISKTKNDLTWDVLRSRTQKYNSTMPNISFKRISCDVTTDIIHRGIQQFTQSNAADFVKANSIRPPYNC
ncbi:hypothetical protein LOAG_04111 [Loa loa]|uniref:Uncharacterized protein n=1 Tax=Loa loa TaxID=7209 RepID=A0A1S0U2R3_LOALO|nr:hypothetical protein LOAG_04111 [Loa loa]EFO24378.1 hypothetical protein LOAG_04111 [Loa loa]